MLISGGEKVEVVSGGFGHSAMGSGGAYHVVNPDIRLGVRGNLMFPSISCLFLHWGGPKSIAKLDGGHGRISPMETPQDAVHLNAELETHFNMVSLTVFGRENM